MSCQEEFIREGGVTYLHDEMVGGMLDPEMIEDAAWIMNAAVMDKVQVNLIINNRAGGNAPLLAQKIADRLRLEKQGHLS
jgi:hypothetical protein